MRAVFLIGSAVLFVSYLLLPSGVSEEERVTLNRDVKPLSAPDYDAAFRAAWASPDQFASAASPDQLATRASSNPYQPPPAASASHAMPPHPEDDPNEIVRITHIEIARMKAAGIGTQMDETSLQLPH